MQEIQEILQTDRTNRARSAILAGRFRVTRIGPLQWKVKNGDRLPYAVSLQPSHFNEVPDKEGFTWVCTCMDYLQQGPEILCKHIEGVRLLETAQNPPNSNSDKEVHMNKQPSTEGNPEDPERPAPQGNDISQEDTVPQRDKTLQKLCQPLERSALKQCQVPGLGNVPYLDTCEIINRANAIFDFAWSFELIGEPVIIRWQRKILVWNSQEKRKVPLLDNNGVVQTEEVGIVTIRGKVTIDLDGKPYSHADLGHCIFNGDTPEALDMALAGSVADCLKRCFRQLGENFGSQFYDKEIAQNVRLVQSRENNHASHPTGSTETQASLSPKTSMRKYSNGVMVNGNKSEQQAFDRFKSKTGKTPASKDALRTWITNQPQEHTNQSENHSAPASVIA